MSSNTVRRCEIFFSEDDKHRLVELLSEADAILNRYPHSNNYKEMFVTTASRAKNATAEALKWCKLLDVEKGD